VTKYLVKRFLLMLPTLLGVALVTFLLIRVIPGDVVELRYSGDRGAVSQDVLDKERARIGLDKPVWQQFATWIWGVVRLDFGTSMWTGAPIWEEIKLRFALSLQVAIMATIVAVLLAIPLGVLAALKQDSWIDYAVRIFSIAGLAKKIADVAERTRTNKIGPDDLSGGTWVDWNHDGKRDMALVTADVNYGGSTFCGTRHDVGSRRQYTHSRQLRHLRLGRKTLCARDQLWQHLARCQRHRQPP